MPQSEQLSFKKTVASLTEETQDLASHFNGVIAQILIASPPGPRHTVEIQVRREQDPIFPTDGGYFTIDNATVSFPMNERVRKGDIIKTEWVNHGDHEHTISVVVSIVGEEPRAVTL